MIEVRIRLASRAEAIHLCEWMADNLDAVIPTIKEWGGMQGSDIPDNAEMTGQFYMTDTAAFFEVVIHDDEVA